MGKTKFNEHIMPRLIDQENGIQTHQFYVPNALDLFKYRVLVKYEILNALNQFAERNNNIII